jgi:hypothetical protein
MDESHHTTGSVLQPGVAPRVEGLVLDENNLLRSLHECVHFGEDAAEVGIFLKFRPAE